MAYRQVVHAGVSLYALGCTACAERRDSDLLLSDPEPSAALELTANSSESPGGIGTASPSAEPEQELSPTPVHPITPEPTETPTAVPALPSSWPPLPQGLPSELTYVDTIRLTDFGLYCIEDITRDPISHEFILFDGCKATLFACKPNGPFMSISPITSEYLLFEGSGLSYDSVSSSYVVALDSAIYDDLFATEEPNAFYMSYDRVGRVPGAHVELKLWDLRSDVDDTDAVGGLAMDAENGRFFVNACAYSPTGIEGCETEAAIWEVALDGSALRKLVTYSELEGAGITLGYGAGLTMYPLTGELLFLAWPADIWAIQTDTLRIRHLYSFSELGLYGLYGMVFNEEGDLAIVTFSAAGFGEDLHLFDANGDMQFRL